MKRTHWYLLVAFTLVTFFANIGSLPTDIMESRNIVTAREMVSDGCWLVPTMNGELRLEKPPLPTWVAGVAEMAFPRCLAAQRVAAGAMGCVWTLFLFLLVRWVCLRDHPDVADDLPVATVVVFLTCYNVVLMGRSATWDIYCHAFMMAAIYYLTRALYEERHCRQRFALAGLLMGLSFMSKGPVSFYALLLPYLIMLVALPRPAMKGKWKWAGLMIGVAVVVGGWWYAYLLIAHPEEVKAVMAKESGAWTHRNVRSWWYYWRFFLEMGAWALLMLAALAFTYWKRHITLKREYLLSITWAVASLVLLSLMPEKKMRYLLPTLAPCSIVVACLLVHFKMCFDPYEEFEENSGAAGKLNRWLYAVNGWIMTAFVLSVPFLAYFFGVRRGLIEPWTEVLVCVAMPLIALWLALSTIRRLPMRFLAGIAAVFAFAELFLLGAIGGNFGNPGGVSIAAINKNYKVSDLPLYHNSQVPLRIEEVYGAGRKILPLDFSNPDSVKKRLPCAVLTHKWAGQELSPELLNNVDTVYIGTFDDNKHPKSNRHYTSELVYRVTVLKEKMKFGMPRMLDIDELKIPIRR